MLRLEVNNFSCIKKAVLDVSPLTVIIGEQGSGKSLLCKLMYFCVQMSLKQYQFLITDKHLDEFISEVKHDFLSWFPVSTWGGKEFLIKMDMGDYQISIRDAVETGGGRVSVDLSESAVSVYEQNKFMVSELIGIVKGNPSRNNLLKSIRLIRDLFFDDFQGIFIRHQIFVPAARSFFLNVGKTISVYDNMDAISKQFGLLYSSLYDELLKDLKNDQGMNGVQKIASDVLNGELVSSDHGLVLKSIDERIIPFSLLSSGQQELMPLILVLHEIKKRRKLDGKCELFYIEEPDAHLFPAMQNKITKYLCSLVNKPEYKQYMVMTTHSPYVLSTINNLVKAGELLKKDGLTDAQKQAVNDLVPPEFQLEAQYVKAYAIVNGMLTSIVDEETHLISGDYIDSVSSDIVADFSALLDIEYES